LDLNPRHLGIAHYAPMHPPKPNAILPSSAFI
jgi:hypothetical protein